MAATVALSANSCTIRNPSSSRLFFNSYDKGWKKRHNVNFLKITASSDDSDCNTEECAPDKEVGKVSVEWLAGEKTKVVGTFPPRSRGWTGYVEKDTAGQKNIYSVEPKVYVAESAISSGTAGSSADGSENTMLAAGGLALISIAATSAILLQVGKNPPPIQAVEYSGPSLSYYINRFKPTEIVEAAASLEIVTSTSLQSESSNIEVPQVQVQSESLQDSSISSSSIS